MAPYTGREDRFDRLHKEMWVEKSGRGGKEDDVSTFHHVGKELGLEGT